VRASLLAAATLLFAEHGPRAVSVKQVADAAGVNHGLVHHYFGSKDALVTAVLEHLADDAAVEIAACRPPAFAFAAGGPAERHGRILAHLLLDGTDPLELKRTFPAVQALVDRLRDEGLDRRAAQERAAQVSALVLGWQFFDRYLLTAAGLDPDAGTRTRVLDDAISRLLADL
jgi:AcrR family transcriptional regulator